MDLREPVLRDEASIPTLLARLTTDARDVARAEVDLAKAKVGEAVTRYKGAAIFFGAAAVLGLCAFIALLVGLIMTLAPLVGPGFATLIVVGVVLLIAGVLAMIGKGRLSPKGAA